MSNNLATISPRAWRIVMLSLFLGLIITLADLAGSGQLYAATEKAPDLGMATFKKLWIDTSTGGRLLHFGARIVNIGKGPFEVHGSRPNTGTSTMTVIQRIFDSGGGFRDISTGAVMFYAGDAHKHWHVKNLQSYELIGLSDGAKYTSTKLGFCFLDSTEYDLTLRNAPQTEVYTKQSTPKVCAKGQPEALTALMGISIGWADYYGPRLPDQYIDLAGVPAGQYRLKGMADKANWFLELNENNNCTWTDIELKASGTEVKTLGTSGDSIPCN